MQPSPLSVTLKRASVDDARRILAEMDVQNLSNFSFMSDPLTLAREEDYLCRMTDGETNRLFLITLGDDHRLIGTVGLHEIDWYNLTARIGIMIFKLENRGKGYGAQALNQILQYGFMELSLNRIYLNAFVTNDAALKLYKKLGFTSEGVLEEAYRLNGKFHDLRVMRLLRREWIDSHLGE